MTSIRNFKLTYKLNKWSDNNNLILNFQKKTMLITANNSANSIRDRQIKVTINKYEIIQVKADKFLVDESFNWDKQVNATKKQPIIKLSTLRRIKKFLLFSARQTF